MVERISDISDIRSESDYFWGIRIRLFGVKYISDPIRIRLFGVKYPTMTFRGENWPFSVQFLLKIPWKKFFFHISKKKCKWFYCSSFLTCINKDMNKFLAIKIQQKVKIGSQIPCFFNIRYPTKISDFFGIRLRLFIFTIRSDPNPTFYYPKISVSDLFGIRSITK